MLKSYMLLKWSLSILLIIFASLSFFTMLEIFGKTNRRFNMEKLKRIHRLSGRLFFFVFLVGALGCLYYLYQSKVEFTPRATVHVFSAVAIFLLFSLKMLFVKFYRQFYNYAKLLGIIVTLLSFNLFAFSSGYSLVTSDFKKAENKTEQTEIIVAQSQKGDAQAGKRLFNQHCISCHYPDKKDYKRAAPGLKGLYGEKLLPVSKKPVTDENVRNQIKRPLRYMPSFADLTEQEIANIIAYLKTL